MKKLLLALILLAPSLAHAGGDQPSARQKRVAGAVLMALGGALTVAGISLLSATGKPWRQDGVPCLNPSDASGPLRTCGGYDHEDMGSAGLATIIAGPPLLFIGLGVYFDGERARPVKLAAMQPKVEF